MAHKKIIKVTIKEIPHLLEDMMKNSIIIALFSLLLGACATTSGPATADSAANAIADALGAQKKVADVGHEWRDTGTIIDDAKKAAEAKDFEKATQLAARAERQSMAAWTQYKAQKDAAEEY